MAWNIGEMNEVIVTISMGMDRKILKKKKKTHSKIVLVG